MAGQPQASSNTGSIIPPAPTDVVVPPLPSDSIINRLLEKLPGFKIGLRSVISNNELTLEIVGDRESLLGLARALADIGVVNNQGQTKDVLSNNNEHSLFLNGNDVAAILNSKKSFNAERLKGADDDILQPVNALKEKLARPFAPHAEVTINPETNRLNITFAKQVLANDMFMKHFKSTPEIQMHDETISIDYAQAIAWTNALPQAQEIGDAQLKLKFEGFRVLKHEGGNRTITCENKQVA